MELPPWSWAESDSQEFGYPSPTCELLSGWRIIGSYRDDSARSLIATRASIVDRQGRAFGCGGGGAFVRGGAL